MTSLLSVQLYVNLLSSVVRELAELHKMNASRVSEAEEAALSRETQAKEQLSLTLEKAQEEARIQQEVLANQVKPQHIDHCSTLQAWPSFNFPPNLAVC